MDSFQIEMAVQFCERALSLEPDNVHVLDTMAPLLLEVGDTDQALEVCHGKNEDVCIAIFKLL